MAIIVMNANECDLVHELHLLEEYGNEASYAAPARYRRNRSGAAQPRRIGTRIAWSLLDLPPALVEVGDSVMLLRCSAAVPVTGRIVKFE